MFGGGAMSLDPDVCSRARLARDARFDGKFFIAVLSTKIYCRPICRTRTSKESNVRYFATAAAAAEAGFRPCLRCHPECSPGTPAASGTQNTVSRALRLIGENGLQEGGLEALAERLGIGSRHLRRLFLRHLGASPSVVAQTNRLHFAKKLIDETRLPMAQVALASGFGCVRRFNAAISETYHRTPTQIRRLARKTRIQPEDQHLFRLDFRPPYNWDCLLAFLATRVTPGVEAVESGVYRRTISLGDRCGYFEVSLGACGKITRRRGIRQENNALMVRLQFGDSRCLFSMIERIRAMFDVNADWDVVARTLRKDRALARGVEALPGLRVPGCWDAFELTALAILGQQMNADKATMLAGQLVRVFGKRFAGAGNLTHIFPSAETLASADLESIGLTPARAETIRAFARAVCDGRIHFQGMVDSENLLKRLREIPGIGESVVQYVAMRALRDPDAVPCDDAELARAVEDCLPRELGRRSEVWRPWRAYAAMLIWQSAARRMDAVSRRIPAAPAERIRELRASRATRAAED